MKSQGFTLVEILVAAILVGILAAYGIPAFQNTVQSNQVTSCANQFISAVQLAKSEAISRKLTVIVAPDAVAAAEIGAPAFRVGTDPDTDNLVADADLFQAYQCSGDGLEFNTNPEIQFLSFAPTGFRADGQGQIIFSTCHSSGKAKQITVSTGGAVSSKEGDTSGC